MLSKHRHAASILVATATGIMNGAVPNIVSQPTMSVPVVLGSMALKNNGREIPGWKSKINYSGRMQDRATFYHFQAMMTWLQSINYLMRTLFKIV